MARIEIASIYFGPLQMTNTSLINYVLQSDIRILQFHVIVCHPVFTTFDSYRRQLTIEWYDSNVHLIIKWIV